MRRTVAICAVGVLIAGCGGGGKSTATASPNTTGVAPIASGSTTTSPGVKSALLVLSDMPTGWRESTDQKVAGTAAGAFLSCIPKAAGTVIHSKNYTDGAANSLFSIVGDAAGFDKLGESFLACFRSGMRRLVPASVTVGGGQESFPTVGDRTVGYRIQLENSGSTIATADALFATNGAGLVGLLASAAVTAPDAAREQSLLSTLVGRV